MAQVISIGSSELNVMLINYRRDRARPVVGAPSRRPEVKVPARREMGQGHQ